MKCVVHNCQNDRSNKDSKKAFFHFPCEKTQLKKWLKFCRNKATFKPKTWRICIDHFNEEDICGSVMYNMGYAVKRTLKPGAVPCRYSAESADNTKRNERASRRENKKIVESLLMEAKSSEALPAESVIMESSNNEFGVVDVLSDTYMEGYISAISYDDAIAKLLPEQEKQMNALRKEVKQLKADNEKLENNKKKLEYEINELKIRLVKLEYHNKNFEEIKLKNLSY